MKRKFQPVIKAVLLLLVYAGTLSLPAFSQQGIITTFAGGGPNSPNALSAHIDPGSVAVDASGNLFITATWLHQVFKADPAGNFTLVAGNGTQGFTGDGGPAASASLSVPNGVAVDSQGNIYIAESQNARIRRVDAVTGIITTVAGNYVPGQSHPGFSGDGGPATSASLGYPRSVAVDGLGNLFIADLDNQRIRRVDGATGIITTVAGNGTSGFSGDGGPATSAQFAGPAGMALDVHGNLYVADEGNSRTRRVDAASGIITTVAGNGPAGYFRGDGGPAINASLSYPSGVAVDTQGNLFIPDFLRVRRVDAATQIITTFAGDGKPGPAGDGGPATSASLFAGGLAFDPQGDLYIVDSGRIRRVDAGSGIMNTVVGRGSGGDGGAATGAVVIYPTGVASDRSGNLFITERIGGSVRRVDASTGIINTVAGNGTVGAGENDGDGGPATSAGLADIFGATVDAHGNIFIADTGWENVRRVDGVTGTITTVAGNGVVGFGGDGGTAISASFNYPMAVAVDTHNNLFVADTYNERIRRVDGATGIITTVAGNGNSGFSGDGGLGANAKLAEPLDVALDGKGNLFIADVSNSRVRRLDAATGIISTVAGNGNSSHTGDGRPSTSAGIGYPYGVAIDKQGNLFISAVSDVRRVDAVTGIISTVAGTGISNQNFAGDGGPATAATLGSWGLSVDSQGNLFIADPQNNRVRVVPLPPFVALSATTLSLTSPASGTPSAAQTVTLTNTGLVPLTISGLVIDGTNAADFTPSDDCGGSLQAGANCTINVTFTPSEDGSGTATLTITDDAPGSPHTVELRGAIQAQSKDFSLAVSGDSKTIAAGQTATYDLSISPVGGLSGAVTVTCTGAPSLATCTVSPGSVNLSGSSASPVTVTVSTTARSGAVTRPKPPARPWVWLWIAGLLAAMAAWMMAAPRLAWRRAWMPLAVALLGATLLAACGGGASGGGGVIPGTPAGAYTITVTGNMGSPALEHNVTLTLKVN